MPPLVIHRAPLPGTENDYSLARALADPTGPTTISELAAYLGVELKDIEARFQDPHFRSYVLQELETRSVVQVALIWRMIGRAAIDSSNPQARMEAAKLYLARFDPGMRAGDRDVAAACNKFAETLAREAIKSAPVRHVAVTVEHPRLT